MAASPETFVSLLSTLANITATIGGILVVGAFWLLDKVTRVKTGRGLFLQSGLLIGFSASILITTSVSFSLSIMNVDIATGVTSANRASLYAILVIMLVAFDLLIVAARNVTKAVASGESVGDDKTIMDEVDLPPELAGGVRKLSLSTLDKRRNYLSQKLELLNSSHEFWMAIWKSSPYAFIPAFSVSGIAAFSNLLVTNSSLALVPAVVTAIIGILGIIAWIKVRKLSVRKTKCKRILDDTVAEFDGRILPIKEFFRTEELEPDREDFRGWKYPLLQDLPNSTIVMDLPYDLDHVVGPCLESGRFQNVSFMYPDVIESLDNYKTAKREYFEAARKLYALVSAKYDPNNKIGIDYKVTMVRALGVLSSNGFNANGIRMFSNANERNSFGVSDDCYKRMTEIVDPNGPLKMLDNKEIRIQAFDFESKNTRVFEAGVNARALMDKYFGPRLRQGRFS